MISFYSSRHFRDMNHFRKCPGGEIHFDVERCFVLFPFGGCDFGDVSTMSDILGHMFLIERFVGVVHF